MKPIARKTLAVVVVLLCAALLSGCIVTIEQDWWQEHPRRTATLYIYLRDYYADFPLSRGYVDLYEHRWSGWEYIGTWEADRYGYVVVRDGYLYCDGCGGEDERDFLVVADAPGYYREDFEIELSYRHPSETLTFYLVPLYGRAEAGAISGDDSADVAATPETYRTGADTPGPKADADRTAGKVVVGEVETDPVGVSEGTAAQ
jgi:hypothetical protein